MRVGDYEVPAGWETMSCIYNCGFVLMWKQNEYTDAGFVMDRHITLAHPEPQTSMFNWMKFWRREY